MPAQRPGSPRRFAKSQHVEASRLSRLVQVGPGFTTGAGVGVVLGVAQLLSCTPCEPIAPLRPDPAIPAAAEQQKAAQQKAAGPTVEEAQAFMTETETQLRSLWVNREHLSYVQDTYITHDTELLTAHAEEHVMQVLAEKVKASQRWDAVALPAELRRKFDLLRLAQTLAAPPDPAERTELASIATSMQGHYGKAKYCPAKLGGKCISRDDLERTIKNSQNYDELLEAWTGWHDQAKPLRGPYARYVTLANKGARSQGFADVGALWRSKYDMPPDAFEKDVERLFQQVEPLYKQLHCYTRMKLRQRYGQKVPQSGPIPAHLLGNMWAQDWVNIYPLVAPAGKAKSFDLQTALKRKNTDPKGLVKYGENFFTSLGLDALPDSFWSRSMFVRPRDRDVECHASAWDLTFHGDLRLKMCIELDEDNFRVVHHELGHIYYYWYYRDLPILFQQGANDGFHEGIGDSVALSITPAYLKKIGLLDQVNESPADDVAFLLRDALDRVSFLPFGMLIDKWRWQVFSGQTKPEEFNKAWWDLRMKYQGIAPPVQRGEEHFDPGAKYHIPSNVPYMRYFLAHILEFQFHRALCQAAGHNGPLYKCSVYGNRAAGDKLKAMLAMGASRPWQEALQAATGTNQVDASALLDYYQPLSAWLAQQTQGEKCGW